MHTMIKETFFLRSFGLAKVPMIFFLRPSVLELNEKRVVIKMPLSYRSKNHLGSMYFGALCVGADCAGGIMAMKLGRERGKTLSLVFKDFEAKFLKRADGGDVHFICEDGLLVSKLIDQAIATGERVNQKVHVKAIVPKKSEDAVAEFILTLSVKVKVK